ncbi:MAG: molybdopterin-dependent oxidoreductase, partial [Oscillospiraceae bacterium]
MNELERKIKAKIPGEDTGIEIRRSLCDICSPGAHCGVDLYIKDGKIIKVEGTENHPMNNGKLCTKGAANREYVYREDRIKTPLKRVGKRGEGLFKEISWDEAYDEIAQRLNKTKSEHGAEAVAFFTGFSKWYRPMFRRFAYSFGSQNYGSESSCCYLSAYMAWKVMAGDQANPDMANSDLFLGWAYNPYYSNYLAAQKATELKAKGLKFIIIDTRSTPATEKLADLALYPRSGTDGALALCMANILVENDWIDKDFISKYTHGFEEYKEYLKDFNESNVESLTGVPYKDVYKAASMIHESRSMCVKESSAPLMHHKNGFQNYRAIMSLL